MNDSLKKIIGDKLKKVLNTKTKRVLAALLILAILAAVSCFFGMDLPDPSLEGSIGSSQSTQQSSRPSDSAPPSSSKPTASTEGSDVLDRDGFYYTKEDVALYIHTYGRLPENFVTKSEAKSQFGSNYKAMQAGYRIGGDRFGNREGRLPAKSGRTWTECDIVAEGKTERGALRIVFSNDGLVYYTSDHYNSFTLLYGEP